MKVLVLSPYPERLAPTLERYGDEMWFDHNTPRAGNWEWAIAWGYRSILPQAFLDLFPSRIINIHIGLLPWNRGADPNFWSWFDNTPKGVTIHQITAGIDKGPILAQYQIPPSFSGHTLRSSYDVLMREAQALFDRSWGDIRAGKEAAPQVGSGSFHRQADKDRWMKNLQGWDATCVSVERLGESARLHA